MSTITTTVAKLRSGDLIKGGDGVAVTGVQSLGSVFIVDFADGTATPPIPNGRIKVFRPHPDNPTPLLAMLMEPILGGGS